MPPGRGILWVQSSGSAGAPLPVEVQSVIQSKNGGGFPVVEDLFTSGGFRVNATNLERNQTPFGRRKLGMRSYVTATGFEYRLNTVGTDGVDLIDANWDLVTYGASVSPATSVVSETSFGQTQAVGVATTYAREDHTHGSPTNPIPAHVAAVNPHTQYQLGSAKDQPNGYAGLDGSSLILPAELPIFTTLAKGAVPISPGGTTSFLRADGTFATPSGGGGSGTLITVTTNYTALLTDGTILVDATSGPVTITLPAATLGKTLDIKKIDSTFNIVTISGGTIDGLASQVLARQNGGVVIQSDATSWWILSKASAIIPVSLTYAGTVPLSFLSLNNAYTTMSLTGDLVLTSADLANGLAISIRLVGDVVDRNLTTPVGWKILGIGTTTVPANKTILMSAVAYGPADTDVEVSFGIQL